MLTRLFLSFYFYFFEVLIKKNCFFYWKFNRNQVFENISPPTHSYFTLVSSSVHYCHHHYPLESWNGTMDDASLGLSGRTQIGLDFNHSSGTTVVRP